MNKKLKCQKITILLALAIFFGFGVAGIQSQTTKNLWPDSRYDISTDGIVIDKRTNLMWKRCAEGQSGFACRGTALTFHLESFCRTRFE